MIAANDAKDDRRDPRRAELGMNGRSPLRQQTVFRHRIENTRLAEQHHQHDGRETEDRADLHQQSIPSSRPVASMPRATGAPTFSVL